VPGFLSAATYKSTWKTYQEHLCTQLNQQVLGTTYESFPVRELHEALSRRPADAATYNIAAQAHHNHFFWNTLSSFADPPGPALSLEEDIKEYFESLPHLRDEFTDAALSLFGNGYVWLMKEISSTRNLRILCTYNAGSPFPAAHMRRQSPERNPANNLSNTLSRPQNNVGSFGPYASHSSTYYQGSLRSLPIMCLKVWEHQYMPDYGITGKEAYVHNWWKHIDWDEVQNLYNLVPEDASELYHASRRGLGEIPSGSGSGRSVLHPLSRVAQRSMPNTY
jgi:Fe-Mn family superoxide dismutase